MNDRLLKQVTFNNADNINDTFSNYENYRKLPTNKKYISSGFNMLDKALNGGFESGLYIVSALSGIGKTTFTLQIAHNISKTQRPVLFFSFEMSKHELFNKCLSREQHIKLAEIQFNDKSTKKSLETTITDIKNNNINADNTYFEQTLQEFKADLNYLNIIECSNKTTIEEIETVVRNVTEQNNNVAPIIFIDYLQKVNIQDGYNKSERKIIDDVLSACVNICTELETVVIAISSLVKSANNKSDVSALKESGNINYDSNGVLFLRDGNKPKKENHSFSRYIEFEKNRFSDGFDSDGNIISKQINYEYIGKYGYFKEITSNK